MTAILKTHFKQTKFVGHTLENEKEKKRKGGLIYPVQCTTQ